MRHWYLVLVLLFLPLQWAWAEAASCTGARFASGHPPVVQWTGPAAGPDARDPIAQASAAKRNLVAQADVCSISDYGTSNLQICDPVEFDLPQRLPLPTLALCGSLIVAGQYPPLSAPVFRADRPPRLLA